MKGIRILTVKIDNNIFPISPIYVDNNSQNFYTVIIGVNAVGKTRLLVNMLNGLRKIGNSRLLKDRDNEVILQLVYNGNEYEIGEDSHNVIENFNTKINLLSISNSLFDKFPHQVKSDKNYSYIGSRITGISTHRRAIINDLMDIFSINLSDETFIKKAKQLFEFLNIKPLLKISFKTSQNSAGKSFNLLLSNNSSVETLKLYLIVISHQGFYRQQSKVLESYLQNTSFLDGFHAFLNTEAKRLSNNYLFENVNLDIYLDDPLKNESFIKEYEYYSFLRRINIITYDYIKLQKGKIEYDILDSSTGEIGLLITFLRAIPDMKSNSIIFIDEPELSLHPSWQMKYIDLLRNFLRGYSGCHILIATHSHFLLSDLKQEWSSVLVLKQFGDKIKAELKKYTPFGWSPEAILYEIFGVANVRNHYFEYDLRKMLSLISQRTEKIDDIKEIISKLKQFPLLEGDPLHLIIKEADDYVKSKSL